jgi:hypothetical protein
MKSPLIHSLKNLVNSPHLLMIGGELVQANSLRINQNKTISIGHLFLKLDLINFN